MARIPPLLLVPPVLFAGLAAMFLFGMGRGDPENLPSAFIGREAPAMTAEALPGHPPITRADLASGKVVLVNFWASWCPPCRAEHPNLMKLRAQGLTVLGVNFADKAGDAQAYLDAEGNPFAAIAFDPNRRTAVDWGVSAPPESFLVDGEGRVVFKFIGPLVGSDFEQRFLPALKAAQAGE
jgi:cytochrome c biogenesis protein CcmG/thiol:disulfide interchange protein DsbE